MRLALLSLALIVTRAAAAEPPDALRLRARAALALAFAEPTPPTYAEQYAKAVKDAKPLVVWVGQPARPVGGALGVACDDFPGVGAEAVVVGVPAAGGLRRIDLPGRPTDAAVRAALRGSDQLAPAPLPAPK